MEHSASMLPRVTNSLTARNAGEQVTEGAGNLIMVAYCGSLMTGIDANRTVKDELAAAVSRRSARRRIDRAEWSNRREHRAVHRTLACR